MKITLRTTLLAAVLVFASMLGYEMASATSIVTYTASNTQYNNCYSWGNTMRRGSRGSQVVHLQEVLSNYFDEYITQDGIFGRMTAQYVKNFQAREGLSADGVVGRRTRQALTDWCKNFYDNYGGGTTGGRTPVSRTAEFGQSVTLYEGDSVQFPDGMRLDIANIDDERCSTSGYQCFWAGDIRVLAQIYGGNTVSRDVNLSTYNPKKVTIDGYDIELIAASDKTAQIVVNSSYYNYSTTVQVGREFTLRRGESVTIQGRSITLRLDGVYSNECEAQDSNQYCTSLYQPVAKMSGTQGGTNLYVPILKQGESQLLAGSIYLRLMSIENYSGQQSARFMLDYYNNYYDTNTIIYDPVNVSGTSATVSASLLSTMYTQSGYIEYGTEQNNLIQRTSERALSTGRLTATIDGLRASTTYYYRAVIVEYVNGSTTPNYRYGDVKTFTTGSLYYSY